MKGRESKKELEQIYKTKRKKQILSLRKSGEAANCRDEDDIIDILTDDDIVNFFTPPIYPSHIIFYPTPDMPSYLVTPPFSLGPPPRS